MGRTDAEAPIVGPSDVKNPHTGKDPDAGKDLGQEKKGATEDEMVGCHHQLDGLECEQTSGVGDRQESLVCCSPWVAKSQTRLTELKAVPPIPASCASLSKFHLTSLSFSVHICKMEVIIAISVVCKDP